MLPLRFWYFPSFFSYRIWQCAIFVLLTDSDWYCADVFQVSGSLYVPAIVVSLPHVTAVRQYWAIDKDTIFSHYHRQCGLWVFSVMMRHFICHSHFFIRCCDQSVHVFVSHKYQAALTITCPLECNLLYGVTSCRLPWASSTFDIGVGSHPVLLILSVARLSMFQSRDGCRYHSRFMHGLIVTGKASRRPRFS